MNFRFLILFLLFSSYIQGQHHIIEYDSINSSYLQEVRHIKVSIPKKYNQNSNEKLDVLYVLDGEWATSLSETVYEFLEYAEFIPTNIIIVSIPNYYKNGVNMRRRDFTPTKINNQTISGGADNFLSFLKEELIPLINGKYSTNADNNILYGSSLGGLFTIYTYLKDPALFKSYLTIEPVIRWDNNYINSIALDKLQNAKNVKNTLWISSRDGKASDDMGISKFESLLTTSAPQNLHWKVKSYTDETHFSVIWKGIYDGLKFTYAKSKTNKKIINRADVID